MKAVKRLMAEENGQGMVEYALIIGLVGVMLIGALTILKDGLVASLGESANQIPH